MEFIMTEKDVETKYSEFCISPNQPDSIRVQVTLPNNKTLSTDFAVWDTILNVKSFILPVLQPEIDNIRQIRCIVDEGHRQIETGDHTVLKHIWNNCPIQVLICIEPPRYDVEKILHVPNSTAQHSTVHPEYGNVLDTNAVIPKQPAGYRNRKTGKLYRNTSVQTSPHEFDTKSVNTLAIQTIQTRDITSEVDFVEFGTQTETLDTLQSLNVIKTIVARPYILYEPNPVKDYDKYARIIQKSVRVWMVRKKFERMLNHYNYLKEQKCNEEEIVKNTLYTKQQRAIINMQYPTKTEDFEALYSAIHKQNVKYYKKNRTLNFRIIKNKLLLAKEYECLKEIIKRRIEIKKSLDEKKMMELFNEISKPKKVTRKNGGTIFIETPEMSRAKLFRDIYVNLKRNDLSKTERIELLLKLRETLKQFEEVDLTKPVIDVITRELTMMNTLQLGEHQLQSLRKRLEVTVQWLLTQPDINPAITKTPKPVNLFKCYNCKKLKCLNKFVVKTKTTTCKDCKHLYRITVEGINLMPYEEMLRNIKATETQLCAKSSVAFFLNTEDIYYLVTIVWKGKSAICESKDVLKLTLVRWCNQLEWSPSNTILLTVEEAYVHSKIRDINKVYTSTFIESVNLKHMIAKKYFKGLTVKSLECDRNIERQKYM